MPEATPIPEGHDPEAAVPEPTPEYENRLTRNQRNFLEAYKVLGGIFAALREVKLHHSCHSRWMHQNADYYPEAFAAATDIANDTLLINARARALTTSDYLMGKFLQARFPEFRPKQEIQVSGPEGGAIGVDVRAMDARCREDPKLAALIDQLAERMVMQIPKPVSPAMLPPPPAHSPTSTNGHNPH